MQLMLDVRVFMNSHLKTFRKTCFIFIFFRLSEMTTSPKRQLFKMLTFFPKCLYFPSSRHLKVIHFPDPSIFTKPQFFLGFRLLEIPTFSKSHIIVKHQPFQKTTYLSTTTVFQKTKTFPTIVFFSQTSNVPKRCRWFHGFIFSSIISETCGLSGLTFT